MRLCSLACADCARRRRQCGLVPALPATGSANLLTRPPGEETRHTSARPTRPHQVTRMSSTPGIGERAASLSAS